MLLSVVVPVFNEDKILYSQMLKYGNYLDLIVKKNNWQYIFVNNGSTDNSLAEIKKIISIWPKSKYLNLNDPNYGYALRTGVENSEAEYCNIINVEQWDVNFIAWSWSLRKEYDLFLGSKRADPTINFQPPFRRFLSWGLNSILSLLFETVSIDTHGPKLINIKNTKHILSKIKLNRGQYDTEMSIRIQRSGLWIAEAPILYKEVRKQKNMMYLKIIRNIIDILKLRKILKKVPFKNNVNLRKFSYKDLVNEFNKLEIK